MCGDVRRTAIERQCSPTATECGKAAVAVLDTEKPVGGFLERRVDGRLAVSSGIAIDVIRRFRVTGGLTPTARQRRIAAVARLWASSAQRSDQDFVRTVARSATPGRRFGSADDEAEGHQRQAALLGQTVDRAEGPKVPEHLGRDFTERAEKTARLKLLQRSIGIVDRSE